MTPEQWEALQSADLDATHEQRPAKHVSADALLRVACKRLGVTEPDGMGWTTFVRLCLLEAASEPEVDA